LDFPFYVSVASQRGTLDALQSHHAGKLAVFLIAQNSMPRRVSFRNSSKGMYGSCHRSVGMTPLYAKAASLMMAHIVSESAYGQRRIKAVGYHAPRRISRQLFTTSYYSATLN